MRRHRILPNFRITPQGVTARLTRPTPWRPMTDAEWEAVMHFMFNVNHGRGRPTIAGARASLDACFHAACMDGPWRELPPEFGKPGSVSRLFRRWTHAGLWRMMLQFVAKERRGLEAIQYWVCRAYRRAARLMGIQSYTLARRLGMDSALRGPSWLVADTQLSAYLFKVLLPRLRENFSEYIAHAPILHRLHSLCMGLRSLRPHQRLATWEREGWDDYAATWQPEGLWNRAAPNLSESAAEEKMPLPWATLDWADRPPLPLASCIGTPWA